VALHDEPLQVREEPSQQDALQVPGATTPPGASGLRAAGWAQVPPGAAKIAARRS
jgi:hypothetical protein